MRWSGPWWPRLLGASNFFYLPRIVCRSRVHTVIARFRCESLLRPLTRPLLASATLLLLSLTGEGSAWAGVAAGVHWQERGTVEHQLQLGDYSLTLLVEEGGERGGQARAAPSLEAEAAAWLLRNLNGAQVRYDEFLGSERFAFMTGLAERLVAEPPEGSQAELVVRLVYDRDGDGRLSRYELRRGNRAMASFTHARARGLVEPGTGFQALPPLRDALGFTDAWLGYEAREDIARHELCPDCIGLPHLDKLAALSRYLQEYAPLLEGAWAGFFVPGCNRIFLELGAPADRDALLRLDGPDGRSYFDGVGGPGGALDGQVDMVTSMEPFHGASYNAASSRYERREVSAANQWMYEVMVDLAHTDLPPRWRAAPPTSLGGEAVQSMEWDEAGALPPFDALSTVVPPGPYFYRRTGR